MSHTWIHLCPDCGLCVCRCARCRQQPAGCGCEECGCDEGQELHHDHDCPEFSRLLAAHFPGA